MVDASEHGACVDAWLQGAVNRLPSNRLLRVFDRGFAALWDRAHQTLGDVTLMAIADRVLYVAAEQYPFLSTQGRAHWASLPGAPAAGGRSGS